MVAWRASPDQAEELSGGYPRPHGADASPTARHYWAPKPSPIGSGRGQAPLSARLADQLSVWFAKADRVRARQRTYISHGDGDLLVGHGNSQQAGGYAAAAGAVGSGTNQAGG
ncbi:hypothetical protein Ade02nite_95920 [Paractinoplanes deccanensis]|uniref:Uncharacterized protein n=1 Tax=Paractinoplanes deccanensis TaxID=113561 RepID=A0ABQ3YLS9_9ACTN|nr:hypothetical protein Ade02nite_95920 [Actinoplanes deccanensis]